MRWGTYTIWKASNDHTSGVLTSYPSIQQLYGKGDMAASQHQPGHRVDFLYKWISE